MSGNHLQDKDIRDGSRLVELQGWLLEEVRQELILEGFA